MAAPAWSLCEAGLRVTVRLTPRGGRDAIDGIEALTDGRQVLRCRVRSAPTGGEANTALVALLAKALGVPKSAVTLGQGAASRIKTLVIAGDGAALAARLARLLT